MSKRKTLGMHLAPLTVTVVTVATPATVALSIYIWTQTPAWRPLAATLEASLFAGDRVPLVVVIGVPPTDSPQRREALEQYISTAVKGKGVHPIIEFRDIPGGDSYVFYHVGANELGPYPLNRAHEGLDGAVAAYWRQLGEWETPPQSR